MTREEFHQIEADYIKKWDPDKKIWVRMKDIPVSDPDSNKADEGAEFDGEKSDDKVDAPAS